MRHQHFGENSSLWWNVITLINIYHFDGNKVKIKDHDKDQIFNERSLRWKLIMLMKFISLMKTHKCDENFSFWWRFITAIENHYYDKQNINLIEYSLLWWKFITLIRIHHFEENSSIWCNFITLMKIHHSDEILSF